MSDKIKVRAIFAVSGNQLGHARIECPVPLRTIERNADRAIKNAELARSSLQKFNDALAHNMRMDAGSSVIIGPIKGKDRIVQKAIARYDGDVGQVSDVCRSRIRLDGPHHVKLAKDILSSQEFRASLAEKGVRILFVEDRFERPTKTHWMGLVIKAEVDLGKGRVQKTETVMIPKGWYEGYERSHVYLENIRALEDLASAQNRGLTEEEAKQAKNYVTMATEIHRELAVRDGYDSLISRPSNSHLSLVGGPQ